MQFKCIIATTIACCLACSADVRADVRSDTTALLTELRVQGVAANLPDQMKNIDATFALAEMYYQLNDRKNAERYYTLTHHNATALLQASQRPTGAASPPPVGIKKQQPLLSEPYPEATTFPIASQGPVLGAVTDNQPETDALNQQQASPAPEMFPDTACCSTRLVGKKGTYTVVKGDTIRLVAAKLGVTPTQLAAANGLKPNAMLRIGQMLYYNNRRIIPEPPLRDGIIVNIPDRMLYLFQNGTVTFSTAVALGTPTKTDQFVWQTPTGRFRVKYKAKDPTWVVPPSIQEEMKLAGKEVLTSVTPGPTNPLGKYAISTTLPGILIHSTSKPWSIYSYASHGCIRVHPDQMETLFKKVWKNAPGEIIYRPVKMASSADGPILLEVHTDIYKKSKDLKALAKQMIVGRGLEHRVDWDKVHRVVARRSGVAEEISRVPQQTYTDQLVQKVHSPSYSDGSVPLTNDSKEPPLPRANLPLLGLTRTTEISAGTSNR